MDYALEQVINGPAGHHPLWDALMRHAASWAEPAFVALIVVWFLVGWLRGQPGDRQGAIAAGLAAAIGLLANQAVAQLWARPRPFVAHAGAVHPLVAHAADSSFPSDHATAAFAIAGVLFARHARLGLLAVIGAAVAGYARVYCGLHYPGDVAAGAVIGLIVAVIVTVPLGLVMAELRRLVDRLIVALRLPLPPDRDGDGAAAPLPRRRAGVSR